LQARWDAEHAEVMEMVTERQRFSASIDPNASAVQNMVAADRGARFNEQMAARDELTESYMFGKSTGGVFGRQP
jgi:hypothetical protein